MGQAVYGDIDASSVILAKVQGADDLRYKPFKPLVIGDNAVIDLFLTGQGGLENIQAYSTIRLGIGELNGRPTGGDYTFGSPTQTLSYDHTAAALQTAVAAAVNANTTTLLAPFVFHVVFTNNGAETLPTVDPESLTPDSTVNVSRLVAGDGSTQEEWLWRLYKDPLSEVTSWTNITGSGLRGALPIGTTKLYQALGSSTETVSTAELELTDGDGNIQTIFQVPITIRGEVLGQGNGSVATYSTYLTAADRPSISQRGNTIFLDADFGSDSTGTKERADLPFATVTAALAVVSSGDLLFLRAGMGEELLEPTVSVNAIAQPGTQLDIAPTITLDINAFGELARINASSGSVVRVDLQGSESVSAKKVEAIDDAEVTIRNGKLNGHDVLIQNQSTVRLEGVHLITADSPAIEIEPGGTLIARDAVIESTATNGIPLRMEGPSEAHLTNVSLLNSVGGAVNCIEVLSGTPTVHIGGILNYNTQSGPASSIAIDGGILNGASLIS